MTDEGVADDVPQPVADRVVDHTEAAFGSKIEIDVQGRREPDLDRDAGDRRRHRPMEVPTHDPIDTPELEEDGGQSFGRLQTRVVHRHDATLERRMVQSEDRRPLMRIGEDVTQPPLAEIVDDAGRRPAIGAVQSDHPQMTEMFDPAGMACRRPVHRGSEPTKHVGSVVVARDRQDGAREGGEKVEQRFELLHRTGFGEVAGRHHGGGRGRLATDRRNDVGET